MRGFGRHSFFPLFCSGSHMKKFFDSGLGRLIYLARYRILLTYVLSIAASIFMMFYPLLVGNAVDGVLAHNVWGLLPLAVVWSSHIVLDLFRQVFDTRTFARIDSLAATELITKQRQAGTTTSTISARVNMQEEFSKFFAYDVPGTIMYTLSPIGALFMVYRFELWTGLVATIYLAATLAFNRWMYPLSKALHQRLNTRTEQNVEVNAEPDLDVVDKHYKNLAKDYIEISDFDAKTWGVVEVATMGLFILAVVRLGGVTALSVGEAYAVIAYVQRFTDGVRQVPYLMQRLSRFADIRKRIETEVAV
jgi:ABC-type multidrug transport system fused ATPase/permease subunit